GRQVVCTLFAPESLSLFLSIAMTTARRPISRLGKTLPEWACRLRLDGQSDTFVGRGTPCQARHTQTDTGRHECDPPLGGELLAEFQSAPAGSRTSRL